MTHKLCYHCILICLYIHKIQMERKKKKNYLTTAAASMKGNWVDGKCRKKETFFIASFFVFSIFLLCPHVPYSIMESNLKAKLDEENITFTLSSASPGTNFCFLSCRDHLQPPSCHCLQL